MALRLSILVATMPSRSKSFEALIEVLGQQLTGETELIVDFAMSYNIGTKRNKLLESATGDYVVFVDDDDMVADDYVVRILEAIKDNPDCVGISGVITTNSGQLQQWHISKDYADWYEKDNIYYRTPNHISPVRRELALKVGFPDIVTGEDYEYSKRLYPLLRTENKIDGNIYHYDFKNDK